MWDNGQKDVADARIFAAEPQKNDSAVMDKYTGQIETNRIYFFRMVDTIQYMCQYLYSLILELYFSLIFVYSVYISTLFKVRCAARQHASTTTVIFQ